MTKVYDDIIHLSRHVSTTRAYMAAIKETGRLADERVELDEHMKDALSDRLQIITDRLKEHPGIAITYFQPDEKKNGGAYVTSPYSTFKIINSLMGLSQNVISSSLKISPLEQVKVLETVFEGKSSFEPKDVDLVKDFMLVESNEKYSVYGKTGSAKDTNSWFTGFIEKDNKRTYLAVRIADESQKLAGSVAKSIALDIIEKYYNS